MASAYGQQLVYSNGQAVARASLASGPVAYAQPAQFAIGQPQIAYAQQPQFAAVAQPQFAYAQPQYAYAQPAQIAVAQPARLAVTQPLVARAPVAVAAPAPVRVSTTTFWIKTYMFWRRQVNITLSLRPQLQFQKDFQNVQLP